MTKEIKPPRLTRCDGLIPARRTRFLDVLAETCSVKQAATAIGSDGTIVYRLRRRDAAFAAQWADALQTGYARIETELMAHALGENGPAGAPKAFDAELSYKLLTRKRPPDGELRGAKRLRVSTTDELIDAIEKRLAALARHKRSKR